MSYTLLLPFVSLVVSLAVMTSYINNSDFGESVYLVLSGVLLAGWLTQSIIWTKCEITGSNGISSSSFCPRSRRHSQNPDQSENSAKRSYMALLFFGYLLVVITATYIARILSWRLNTVQPPGIRATGSTEIELQSDTTTEGHHPSDMEGRLVHTVSVPSIVIEDWDFTGIEPTLRDQSLQLPPNAVLIEKSKVNSLDPNIPQQPEPCDDTVLPVHTVRQCSAMYEDRLNSDAMTVDRILMKDDILPTQILSNSVTLPEGVERVLYEEAPPVHDLRHSESSNLNSQPPHSDVLTDDRFHNTPGKSDTDLHTMATEEKPNETSTHYPYFSFPRSSSVYSQASYADALVVNGSFINITEESEAGSYTSEPEETSFSVLSLDTTPYQNILFKYE